MSAEGVSLANALDILQTGDSDPTRLSGATTTINALPALVLGTNTITATISRDFTRFIVGPGTTLTPAGAVTLGGTVVSLPASPTEPVAIINGETSTLAEVTPLITPPPITIAQDVFTAIVTVSSTFYSFAPAVILTPGGVVTVDETRVSLASEATAVVVGTSTVPLAPEGGVGNPGRGRDDSDNGDEDNDFNENGDDADNDDTNNDDEFSEPSDTADTEDGLFSGAFRANAKSTEHLLGLTILVGIFIVLVL